MVGAKRSQIVCVPRKETVAMQGDTGARGKSDDCASGSEGKFTKKTAKAAGMALTGHAEADGKLCESL